MDNNNLTIECRQLSAPTSSQYNNGDWNTKLKKPVKINEGDIVQISKVFLDTGEQNDDKVHIEKDIDVIIDCFIYNKNWTTDNAVYDDAGFKNDGRNYIQCSSTPTTNPNFSGMTFVTQVKFIPEQGVAERDHYGGDSTLELGYIDIDGNQQTLYLVAPSVEYYNEDPETHQIFVNTGGCLAKTGGMAGKGAFQESGDTFAPINTSVFSDEKVSRKFLFITGTGTPSSQILSPRVFSKTIPLNSGKYDPDDLCVKLNNAMGENADVNQSNFNQSSAINSPFLRQSINNTQTQETFNIVFNTIAFNNIVDDKKITLTFSASHSYILGQQVTISGMPTAFTVAGVLLSNLNGNHIITRTDNDAIPFFNGFIEFDMGSNGTATEVTDRVLANPIVSMGTNSGTSDLTINYGINDNTLSNGDSIVIRDGTGIPDPFGGVAKSNIINTNLIIKNLDTANKEFEVTVAGTFNAHTGVVLPQSLCHFLVPHTNTANPIINTTEVTDDTRFLVREDGTRIKQYSNTFNNNTPQGNVWIGSSQMDLQYDPNTFKFFWKFNHMPVYDSGQNIASFIGKDQQTAPAQPNPYYHVGSAGGVIFHSLRAVERGTINIYDFWSAKLGFTPSSLCPNYNLVTKSLSTGVFQVPVFDKLINGKHITTARPTLDSLVVKSGGPSNAINVPNIDSYPATDNDLTTEIFADRVAISTEELRFGYFLIELSCGFKTEINGEEDIRQNIMGIVNRYYNRGAFTSAEGGSLIYQHKGQPLYLNDIKCRILNNEKQLSQFLGSDNTIFLDIQRGALSIEQDDLDYDNKQIPVKKE